MMSSSKVLVICLGCIVALALFVEQSEGNGSCQQYGHSCLGGHGKRSGEDLLKSNPAAARYNSILREMMARLYASQNYPSNDWQTSQESGMDKKNVDYSAV